jgi:sugar phosphate permease
LIFVIRAKVRETPAFARVQEQRALGGKSPRPDLITPFKKYPRQMAIGFVMYTLYVFTWTGYSTWLPTWLVKDYGLDFATAAFWQVVWFAIAIPSYWLCGLVAMKIGNKRAIPLFTMPSALLLIAATQHYDASVIFVIGSLTVFMVQASYGAGASAFVRELFPAEIRGTAAGAIALSSGFVSALAPGIMGILINNGSSIGASFVVPGVSFLLIGPLFYFFAPETVGVKIPDLVDEAEAAVVQATPVPGTLLGT